MIVPVAANAIAVILRLVPRMTAMFPWPYAIAMSLWVNEGRG